MENQTKTLYTYKNRHGTMKNQSGTVKTMKNNLELDWVVTGYGWLQVFTGDSQEEVLIFVTNRHTIHQNIYMIIITKNITLVQD